MTPLLLKNYVEKQISNIFIENVYLDIDSIDQAISKTRVALSKSNNKYISVLEDNKSIPFSVFNTVHYSMFLYFLSNVLFEKDMNGTRAEKIYYLNKTLNCLDIFYEIKMPDIFYLEHPLGTVIGRAKMGDYFFVHQGCTVGENFGDWPVIGRNVTMFTNSIILGKTVIGDNVIISANTYIINETIPSNCIVFGQSPHLTIKTFDESFIREKLSIYWKY